MKNIYIIPGLGENCSLARYKMLSKAIKDKGYNVKLINPDWYRPLSSQTFYVEKDAIIIGFSLGAIIAYLNAMKYICKKVIFASISPLHDFTFKSLVDEYSEYMTKDLAIEITNDIKKIKVVLKNLRMPYITLAGQLENMKADYIVPRNGHKITPTYIKYITNLL